MNRPCMCVFFTKLFASRNIVPANVQISYRTPPCCISKNMPDKIAWTEQFLMCAVLWPMYVLFAKLFASKSIVPGHVQISYRTPPNCTSNKCPTCSETMVDMQAYTLSAGTLPSYLLARTTISQSIHHSRSKNAAQGLESRVLKYN